MSPDLMRRVVEEAEAEGNNSLVARRYGISQSTVSRWRQKYAKGELQVEGTPLDSENTRRLLIENRELKRLLGDRELKIQILEDLLKKRPNAQGQSRNSGQVDNRGYPATTVLRHVGLSRSTYYYIFKHLEKALARRGGRTKPGWSATVDGVRMTDTEIKKCLIKLIEGDGFYYGYRLDLGLATGFQPGD